MVAWPSGQRLPDSHPGEATSFFFFLSWFFYPLAFYSLFSLLTPLASLDFFENAFLVLGVNKVHCKKPYVKITWGQASRFSARKSVMFRYSLLEVPLPFLRIIRRLYYIREPTWLPYRKPFALLLEAPLDWDGQLFKDWHDMVQESL